MAGIQLAPTQRVYLEDSYLFSMEAMILSFQYTTEDAAESESVPDAAAAQLDGSVILDATCFYPQGGGQPTDEGVITLLAPAASAETAESNAQKESRRFVVTKVTVNASAQVVHTGHGNMAFWASLAASSSIISTTTPAAAPAPAPAPAPAGGRTTAGTCHTPVPVQLQVEERLRRLYMRLHTTGVYM